MTSFWWGWKVVCIKNISTHVHAVQYMAGVGGLLQVVPLTLEQCRLLDLRLWAAHILVGNLNVYVWIPVALFAGDRF
jgi:hypothetical protein